MQDVACITRLQCILRVGGVGRHCVFQVNGFFALDLGRFYEFSDSLFHFVEASIVAFDDVTIILRSRAATCL